MKKTLLLTFGTALLIAACTQSVSEEKTTEKVPQPTLSLKIEEDPFLVKGREITQITFEHLSGALSQAMQKGGVKNAVQYCNLAALPLVDSLSKAYQVQIKRTTLKPRNPKNLPSEAEQIVLKTYEEKYMNDEELKPYTLTKKDGTTHFYAPIMLQAQCLQCHGKVGNSIKENDYKVISNLYPEDRAVDYEVGDFRGMWHLVFELPVQ